MTDLYIVQEVKNDIKQCVAELSVDNHSKAEEACKRRLLQDLETKKAGKDTGYIKLIEFEYNLARRELRQKEAAAKETAKVARGVQQLEL